MFVGVHKKKTSQSTELIPSNTAQSTRLLARTLTTTCGHAATLFDLRIMC